MTEDYRKYRLNEIRDLEPFIRYDRDRYLLFNARLQNTLISLPVGRTLTAHDFCPRKQHNLFVKLCCLTCFISRMPANNDKPFTYDMLPDCTGIKKVARH